MCNLQNSTMSSAVKIMFRKIRWPAKQSDGIIKEFAPQISQINADLVPLSAKISVISGEN